MFFNGSKAESLNSRHVLSSIRLDTVHHLRLPSTSPAIAPVCYEDKLLAWCVIAEPNSAFQGMRRRAPLNFDVRPHGTFSGHPRVFMLVVMYAMR